MKNFFQASQKTQTFFAFIKLSAHYFSSPLMNNKKSFLQKYVYCEHLNNTNYNMLNLSWFGKI
ncbi:hypothetical protein BpHYR1_030746 [Brachionus plicatilis]|uniref:Uncharacterized protein n=1 Tax=Brachionus plicatilis TaxID=10195 RepID=A0A3M7PTK7_BRAPC|nr:hypothetical protein BpHYR1_030746 [Brachionus plicatilis]